MGKGRAGGVAVVCLVVGVALAVCSWPRAAAAPPMVRVGLAQGVRSLTITADGPFEARNMATGALIGYGGAWQSWVVSGVPAGISVAGRGVFTGPVQFHLARGVQGEGSRMIVSGSPYRGSVEVRTDGPGTVCVINVLEVEEYLYGVVPREMPRTWPAEALKAQAVASRTYVLSVLGSEKHRAAGFDVCAGIDCQVYGGMNAESPATNAAVDSTRGQVLTYEGGLVRAFFHSSSGGHTEHSENVWGMYLPYLRGVPDPDNASPHAAWKATLTLEEIAAALNREGYNVGAVYGLGVGPERGVSGRPISVAVWGSHGTQVLSSGKFRLAVGLNSTLFEMKLVGGHRGEVTRPFAPEELLVAVGAGPELSRRRTSWSWVVGSDGGVRRASGVVGMGTAMIPSAAEFTGKGKGHGVGMSQWGAYSLALAGYNYRDILRYYYQGVEIETR